MYDVRTHRPLYIQQPAHTLPAADRPIIILFDTRRVICLRRCTYSSSVVRCAKLVLLFYIINSCRVCVSSIRWLFLLCTYQELSGCAPVRNPTYHFLSFISVHTAVCVRPCCHVFLLLLARHSCNNRQQQRTYKQRDDIHTICLPHIYLVYVSRCCCCA